MDVEQQYKDINSYNKQKKMSWATSPTAFQMMSHGME